MRYTIKSDLHDDKSIVSINKLNDRAYFIPFGSETALNASTYLDERYKSDKVRVLDGEWDFKYYKHSKDIPAQLDTDVLKFSATTLPSTWQRTGVEIPWYLNTRYQFKMKPPYIQNDVPVALYRKNVLIADVSRRFVLTFLGVAACVSLYINGEFVGYAEGAHDMNEFDVTAYLRKGNNELFIVVHKFCTGSYLECQDMFRENGIFRDVYITEYAETDIYDYGIKTKRTADGKYDLSLSAEILGNIGEEYTLKAVLKDAEGKEIGAAECAASKESVIDFKSLDVIEWNAEIPTLYTMYITLAKGGETVSVIRQFVGFKTVEIKGELFLLNGQNIKIKGVNHHDTDPVNGWVMTAEQLLRDARIIKEYNCNAVRMSHYPPDPIFMTICDVIGLYVIDEADIECHNIYSNVLNRRYGRISNNLIWKENFLDRVRNMYMRDRNHASVIMWSLGNESGGYMCHDIAYDYLKSVTDIPVHYEGVIHTKRHSYDVISEMYAHSFKVEKIAKHEYDKRYEGKPYFLCEYVHAMGVGPGALSEYMRIFYKYDNIMGGCVWEFADHCNYSEEAKFGYKYTYGGDHGETKHDGNFCVDGMFRPDRSPSSGALNMKVLYRPLLAEYAGDGKYTFTNTNRFRSSGYIDIAWSIMRNGLEAASGKLSEDIPPKGSKTVTFKDVEADGKSDLYTVITYIDRESGAEIAKEQIILSSAPYAIDLPRGEKLELKKNNDIYTVYFDNGILVFDGSTGEIVSYGIDGVEMLNHKTVNKLKGILPNMSRATIDNDRFITILWNILGYPTAEVVFKKADVAKEQDCVKVVSKYAFRKYGKIANATIEYRIRANGSIDVKAKLSRAFKLIFYNEIPRFGVTVEMAKEFDNVTYYGMGDRESLSDFNEHTILGVYNTKVKDMHEFYIKPQESGNRTGVRYAKVTRADGVGLTFLHKGDYFNFNANHYSGETLRKANHIEDLIEEDTTMVQIDGFQRGAGSNSCGQPPLKEHRPNLHKPLEFGFTIIPTSNK